VFFDTLFAPKVPRLKAQVCHSVMNIGNQTTINISILIKILWRRCIRIAVVVVLVLIKRNSDKDNVMEERRIEVAVVGHVKVVAVVE
jgi:hypothetical protein